VLAFGATVLTAFGAGFVLTACATPENETPNTQPVINQPVDPNLPDEKENEITNPARMKTKAAKIKTKMAKMKIMATKASSKNKIRKSTLSPQLSLLQPNVNKSLTPSFQS